MPARPAPSPTSEASEARRPWQLVLDRRFGPFFVGKVLSSCGIWIHNLGAAVLMFQLTSSAFMVGTVSVLQFTAPVVLSLWAGALTDRRNRRKLLMIGQMISGSTMGVLALLVAILGRDGFGGPPVLLAAVLVMGIGVALTSPSMQALVPALVRSGELQHALALGAAGPSVARTVGPAVGAALVVLGGPALAFGVASCTHLGFVVILMFIRTSPHRAPKERPKLLGGIRYLLADRKAGLLMLGVATLAIGSDPILTLTPSLADQLGGGAELVGVLAAGFGVGGIIATVLWGTLSRWLDLRKLGMAGFWVLALGLLFAAAATTAPLTASGFLISGAGLMMAMIALNTRIQRRIPDELRGRVMAMWGVAWLGARPFAAVVNGSIADLVSVRAALITAAVLTIVSSALARVRYGTTQPVDQPRDR